MKGISSHAIQNAMVAAQRAISELPDDGDNVLLLNTIEGESDVLEVLDRVIEHAIADKPSWSSLRASGPAYRGTR